jgi:Na+/proline symporter
VSLLDVAIIAAFVAYAIGSGLRARRQASKNLEEYFLAGRSLSGTKAGISMAATQFAADTPLLVTGLIATAGVFSLWRLWIYALAFLLMGFVLAASWRRAGVVTDAELTELRYAGRPAACLRAIKAVYLGTVFNCVVLAMVLWATKEIVEPFLLWNEWLPVGVFEPVRRGVEAVGVPFARERGALGDLWTRSTNNVLSILAIVGVTFFYSATGGLRSVVRTDLVQFALMLAGTALYAFVLVDAAGGFAGIERGLEALPPGGALPSASEILAFTPDAASGVGTAILAVIALQWLVQMNADGTGYLAQRSMACRSDADARRAAVVFVTAQVLVRSLLWLPIGLALLVLFPPDPALSGDALRADREATYVQGMKEMLPPGLLGLLLAAMLAALGSTLDTHLNWGASYWANDLYGRFWCRARGREPSDRSLVRVARISTGAILLLALGVMTRLGSIQTAWQVTLLFGAGLGVVLVLRWIWWRINAWSEISAVFTSLVTAPLLLALLPAESEAVRLLLVAGASTTAAVGAAVLAGPEPLERLVAFYGRARPPGFWGPVAKAAGGDASSDRSRLLRGLAAVGLAAFSIFCLLVGVGSWLISSPPPDLVPDRALWISLLLGLGLGLVPLWWRLGMPGAGGRASA